MLDQDSQVEAAHIQVVEDHSQEVGNQNHIQVVVVLHMLVDTQAVHRSQVEVRHKPQNELHAGPGGEGSYHQWVEVDDREGNSGTLGEGTQVGGTQKAPVESLAADNWALAVSILELALVEGVLLLLAVGSMRHNVMHRDHDWQVDQVVVVHRRSHDAQHKDLHMESFVGLVVAAHKQDHTKQVDTCAHVTTFD